MSNPSSIWQRLQAGNHRLHAGSPTRRVPTPDGRPVAVVFRCADAHGASGALLGEDRDALVEVSNWGHLIDGGVLASLEHAVGTLKTPLIVILGHSGCSAMKTALDAWNNVNFPQGAVRAVVEQAVSSLARLNGGIGSADELAAAHVANAGVSLLQKSAVIADAVDNGRSAIVCAVSDTRGELRECATFGDLSTTGSPLLECV